MPTLPFPDWIVGQTLVGALRHYDFVPWDDGIAVAVLPAFFDELSGICQMPESKQGHHLPPHHSVVCDQERVHIRLFATDTVENQYPVVTISRVMFRIESVRLLSHTRKPLVGARINSQ